MSTYVPKKTRDNVYRYFFTEGVIVAKKDPLGTWEGELGGKKFQVPAIQIWQLMRSMRSRDLLKEQFAWRHFYWFLNDNGVAFLRKYLHLAETVVPETHQKTQREVEDEKEREERKAKREAAAGGRGRGRGFGRGRGGARAEGGDRDNYNREAGRGRGGRGGFRGRGRGNNAEAPAAPAQE